MGLFNWDFWKSKQLKDVKEEDRLTERDFKIITKNIDTDIFDENNCSLWKGCVCNQGKEHKGLYINYYFKGKKTSLHRLLYLNFRNAHLNRKMYLCHLCNSAICINVNHMEQKKDRFSIKSKEEKEKIYTNIDFQINFDS